MRVILKMADQLLVHLIVICSDMIRLTLLNETELVAVAG